MAVFRGQTITLKGRELLSRALAGEGKFQFTKGAFGEGKHTGDLELVEYLQDHKLDLNVMDAVNDQGTAILTIQITNKNLTESFFTNEFGIFAKIEGDTEEILYSYATAEKADAIPNNTLGTTYESVHDIYMDISSNADATIHVDESILFLTLDVANRNYTQTGLVKRGVLVGRTTLEADKQYQDSNGNWYKNIGGDRSWEGSGEVDSLLIPVTWDNLYKTKEPNITKKTAFNLDKVDDPEDENVDSSFLLATGKALRKVWNKAVGALAETVTNKNAIQNNKEQIENLSDFVLLHKTTTPVIGGQVFQLSESLNNFRYFMIRLGADAPNSNLDTGVDCFEKIFSAKTRGYKYDNVGKAALGVVFRVEQYAFNTGTSGGDAEGLQNGVAIFGLERI